MNVTDKVYFGDISDILRGETIYEPDPGSGIYFRRDTCRRFIGGTYSVHYIQDNVAIFCIDGVNPVFIHEYLKKTDVGKDFKHPNFISRYDWMEYRNWGAMSVGPTEKIPAKLIPLCKRCFITKDKNFYEKDFDICPTGSENQLEIRDASSGEVMALICEIRIRGGWHWGCLLQDKESDLYFAFIYNEEYNYNFRRSFEEELIKFDGKVSLSDFLYTGLPFVDLFGEQGSLFNW